MLFRSNFFMSYFNLAVMLFCTAKDMSETSFFLLEEQVRVYMVHRENVDDLELNYIVD